jgi:phenylacetic acid degradation operon negative regulatory protein
MSPDDAPRLPRRQQGAQPQRLLTTLFGDYWFGRPEPLPSAALVRLLAEFEISATSARAAIQRLAARRFLVGSRQGRETFYGVPPKSREVLDMHIRKVFGDPTPDPWDGTWTVVAFSIPEDDRATRRLVRENLKALHFGRLYDALWISPWELLPELTELGSHVQANQLTVFRGQHLPLAQDRNIVAEAFNLDPLAQQYRTFTQTCQATLEEIEREILSPGKALRTRTETMTAWRRISSTDPRLPRELLGPDWPGETALAACAQLYDSLGAAAEHRFRAIVADHAPDLAELVRHHTFHSTRQLQP